ncbi:MAG: phosphoribosylamine--glycine ligase [Candidatus Syntrophosphaera sp.]
MKILIIGSGGREHALAAAFARDVDPAGIAVAPGNAGIAREFDCPQLKGNAQVLSWCMKNQPDLVVVGPEQPLSEGLSDLLEAHSIPCVGPSKAAARIETSKIFAKEMMARHSIPTAEYHCFNDPDSARAHIRGLAQYPVVVKADILAAGKGVTIAGNAGVALEAIGRMEQSYGAQCGYVVEEYLEGWEVSLFAATDGVDFASTLFSQDHKQLGEGDTGPNTGGMGAFCPVREAELWRGEIEEKIISPTLKALRDEGCLYRGFLYFGLMITASGPKVLEYNCRLGDPETQALLPLLKTPLAKVCFAILEGRVDELKLEWLDKSCVCVVLASGGYPGNYEKGFPIMIGKDVKSRIFFSGVGLEAGSLITAGGRVLSVAAVADSLDEARSQAYQDIQKIEFKGKYFRGDISQRTNKP